VLMFYLNLLDTLFFTLSEDKAIISLLEKDTVLQKLLGPYLITKKKQIGLDALDAAAKKMTAYASMQAERAKWQGILDKMQRKDEKYFHNMERYGRDLPFRATPANSTARIFCAAAY